MRRQSYETTSRTKLDQLSGSVRVGWYHMGGVMSNPEYCAAWDIPKIFRGDTLDGFAVTARKLPSRDPIIPVAVCAHIVDSFGRVIHPMQYAIDPATGTITKSTVM